MSGDRDTSQPWPYWMLRYMMQDDASSFDDLMWSVGGSPPYGGISYDEASAVYKLIENYRGQGMAQPRFYEATRAFLAAHPEREAVLDLFHTYDQIVSASDSYPRSLADQGLAIATKIAEPGPIGLFMLFQSGAAARTGDNAQAAKLTVDALASLLDAAERDPDCVNRVQQAAQNAVALTGLAGDTARALELLDELVEIIPAEAGAQLRRWLAAQP